MENAAGMELLSNDTIAPIAPNVSDTPVMKMESTIPDTSMVRVAPDAPTAEFASSGVPPFKRSSTPSSTDSNQQVDHIHHSPSHSRGWQSDLSSQFPLHSPSFPSGRAQRRPHQHTPPPQPDVVPSFRNSHGFRIMALRSVCVIRVLLRMTLYLCFYDHCLLKWIHREPSE